MLQQIIPSLDQHKMPRLVSASNISPFSLADSHIPRQYEPSLEQASIASRQQPTLVSRSARRNEFPFPVQSTPRSPPINHLLRIKTEFEELNQDNNIPHPTSGTYSRRTPRSQPSQQSEMYDLPSKSPYSKDNNYPSQRQYSRDLTRENSTPTHSYSTRDNSTSSTSDKYPSFSTESSVWSPITPENHTEELQAMQYLRDIVTADDLDMSVSDVRELRQFSDSAQHKRSGRVLVKREDSPAIQAPILRPSKTYKDQEHVPEPPLPTSWRSINWSRFSVSSSEDSFDSGVTCIDTVLPGCQAPKNSLVSEDEIEAARRAGSESSLLVRSEPIPIPAPSKRCVCGYGVSICLTCTQRLVV